MSKIFITLISTVTKTVTMVPMIWGTTTRKKVWAAAGAVDWRPPRCVSSGTPLIAEDSSTIE